MTDTVKDNSRIEVPLDDINIIVLDRDYVENKAQWQEAVDRVARYRIKE